MVNRLFYVINMWHYKIGITSKKIDRSFYNSYHKLISKY